MLQTSLSPPIAKKSNLQALAGRWLRRLGGIQAVPQQPYTHAMHMAWCIAEGQQNRMAARKRVQVMRFGVVYCAHIVEPYTVFNGPDCWTVETTCPQRARFTVPVRLVRDCPADSCTCFEGLNVSRMKRAGHALACPSAFHAVEIRQVTC